jgi:hypothetical protein
MALRLVFRLCYVLMLASGRVAASLARDFRILGEARERVGPLTVVLQLPAGWLLVRPISLAAFSACCTLAPMLQAPSA